MKFEDFTQIQLIDGIMGLIYPTIGIAVGIIIASKYAKFKQKELLFVGLSLIFTVISYLGIGLEFLSLIFFDQVLDDKLLFFLFLGFGSFGLICWISAMATLLAPNKGKFIIGIYAILVILIEIYYIIGIFIDPSLGVIVREGPMDVSIGSGIGQLWALFAFLSVLFSGLAFLINTQKSGNKTIMWKGRFIFTSIILLVIASLMIAFNPTDLTINLISRIMLVSRMIFSYLGWIFPGKLAAFLTKEQG